MLATSCFPLVTAVQNLRPYTRFANLRELGGENRGRQMTENRGRGVQMYHQFSLSALQTLRLLADIEYVMSANHQRSPHYIESLTIVYLPSTTNLWTGVSSAIDLIQGSSWLSASCVEGQIRALHLTKASNYQRIHCSD